MKTMKHATICRASPPSQASDPRDQIALGRTQEFIELGLGWRV